MKREFLSVKLIFDNEVKGTLAESTFELNYGVCFDGTHLSSLPPLWHRWNLRSWSTVALFFTFSLYCHPSMVAILPTLRVLLKYCSAYSNQKKLNSKTKKVKELGTYGNHGSVPCKPPLYFNKKHLSRTTPKTMYAKMCATYATPIF